jgi:transposase InsO family protein
MKLACRLRSVASARTTKTNHARMNQASISIVETTYDVRISPTRIHGRRTAVAEFRERYDQRWIVRRLGYLTPARARQPLLSF